MLLLILELMGLKDKMPSITDLATTDALTVFKNKIANGSSLV